MTGQLAIDLDHREDRLDREFAAFHEANPHVMATLVRLTREARQRGVQRVGMAMLFEVLRWDHALRTQGATFKLNNNLRSRYARAIMAAHPDLAGVYEVRELRPPVPRSLAAA
jgi:hypothetical protein